MNVIRTMQAKEEDWWAALLFEVGPHDLPEGTTRDAVPHYPLTFPFPTKIHGANAGDWLYLLWRGEIIGYGRIREIKNTEESPIGSDLQIVGKGQTVYLEGALSKMPHRLEGRGFTGVRYTETDLHKVDLVTARNALATALGPKKK